MRKALSLKERNKNKHISVGFRHEEGPVAGQGEEVGDTAAPPSAAGGPGLTLGRSGAVGVGRGPLPAQRRAGVAGHRPDLHLAAGQLAERAGAGERTAFRAR